LIVGLAPGAHGANATGRPFTGDYAGILLYQSLHRLGLASAAQSLAAVDGLRLNHCRITNAGECLPPANKPSTAEVDLCNGLLQTELKQVATPGVIFALGGIAHRAVLRALGLRLSRHPFSHAAVHSVGAGLTLVDSYHCSRYNTQTRRLTARMFLDALETARNLALD
jgi:uracil-DNA glycosylase family 4